MLKNINNSFINHNETLSSFDLESLNKLLSSGFSLRESLNLIENKNNAKIIRKIIRKLEEGIEIKTFFHKCIPKKYRSSIAGFLAYTSFAKALELSITIVKEKNEKENKIKQKLIYPLLLVFGTITGLIFFNRVCFPVLIDLANDFNADISIYKLLAILINMLVNAVMFVTILVISVLLYLQKPMNKLKFFQALERKRPSSLLIKQESLNFMYYYLECYKSGISTKNIISLLKNMDNNVVITYYAAKIEKEFNQGETFVNAFNKAAMDSELERFMRISVYVKDKISILEAYINFCEIQIERRIKHITKTVEIIAYLFIAFAIIIIYQILLMPMSLIETL